MIDYGQVKRLSLSERKELAELIVYIADQKDEFILETVKKMGFTTEKNMDSVLLDTVYMGFDSDEIAFKAGLLSIFCY